MGDGIPATITDLVGPVGLTLDPQGNLYIADAEDHRIRQVNSGSGIITTVAGNGTQGFTSDGIGATQASLSGPFDIELDLSGSLYIADSGNHRVRRVNAETGVITTVAGNGTWGSSGDGGVATEANLNVPVAVELDAAGHLLIVDQDNNQIRRVDVITGVITTVAGTGAAGFSGDGGNARHASLNQPEGLAIDKAGNLYIAEARSHRVRRVDASTGIIVTIAGTGAPGVSGDGHPATEANLNSPRGVAVDAAGNLFITDMDNHRIRRVLAATGIIDTVAGTGTSGSSGDGAAATMATLNWPKAVAVDSDGNLFIAERLGSRVRRVEAATGIITTVAGTGHPAFHGDGRPATSASLTFPFGVAADAHGNILVADTVSHRIRRVDTVTGNITTLVGTGISGFGGDDAISTQATLSFPMGIAADVIGNLFIADTNNHRVRRVDASTGVITTIAGIGEPGFSGDGGSAIEANLNSPKDVAVDAFGNLFVADMGNHRIRRIKADTGIISTIAGDGLPRFSGDGDNGTEASLSHPAGLALDASGNIYIADTDNHRIRRVDPAAGVITTVAGTGLPGFIGDGGISTQASLNRPEGLALDGDGNLYIADTNNHRIRRVEDSTGIITTIGGSGVRGPSEDGTIATQFRLSSPRDLALDAAGNLFIADMANNQIHKIEAASLVDTRRLLPSSTGAVDGQILGLPNGHTYYVSTTGSDNSIGTELQPWRSIQHAAHVVAPGDTVLVRGGTYSEGATMFIAKSGAPNNYITFRNYPGEAPIIVTTHNGPGIELSTRKGETSVEWIWIEGLEVQGAQNCLRWRNAANIVLRSLDLHGCSANGILGIGGNRVSIENSSIHHNGLGEPTNQRHGLYLSGNHYIIRNNLIYSNMAFGIQAAGYTAATVPYLLPDYEGSSDWLISNNVIAFEQTRGGIVLWREATKNVIIQNTIFYYNNRMGGNSNGISDLDSGGGHIISHNLFFGEAKGIAVDPDLYTAGNNIFDSDPLFVDPSKLDFHLSDESPAIDSGAKSNAEHDLEGNDRTQGNAVDIGPYEYPNLTSNDPPIAVFSASRDTGIEPTTVVFDASESLDNDGKIADFRWEFGDASEPGTGVKVTHTYGAGTYMPMLTVTDELGATDLFSGTIKVLSKTKPDKQYIWVEAESGELDQLMGIINDDSETDASYIHANASTEFIADGTLSRGATYAFDVPEMGTYRVWGFVSTRYGNSFFVESDHSGINLLWDIPADKGWSWRPLTSGIRHESVEMPWSPGVHTLEIKVREPGTALDRLLITSDLDFLPEGY